MIPLYPFGRTGHQSTRTIFGAAAFGSVTQPEADATMETLLEYNINHIDTAASYGESERLLGPWMEHSRDKFFLATKTGERSYQKAHDEIRRSLERLRVSSVDLLQLHNLVDEDGWQEAMGESGALKAAIEARDEGLTRFIGVTGHGLEAPRMHARSLERFSFDSVLLPWNFPLMQNEQYQADFESLRQSCVARGVAIQTIKAITRGPWGDKNHTRATWYEPLEEQEDIDNAVHWLLGHEGLFLNTVGDIHVLPEYLTPLPALSPRPPTSRCKPPRKSCR